MLAQTSEQAQAQAQKQTHSTLQRSTQLTCNSCVMCHEMASPSLSGSVASSTEPQPRAAAAMSFRRASPVQNVKRRRVGLERGGTQHVGLHNDKAYKGLSLAAAKHASCIGELSLRPRRTGYDKPSSMNLQEQQQKTCPPPKSPTCCPCHSPHQFEVVCRVHSTWLVQQVPHMTV